MAMELQFNSYLTEGAHSRTTFVLPLTIPQSTLRDFENDLAYAAGGYMAHTGQGAWLDPTSGHIERDQQRVYTAYGLSVGARQELIRMLLANSEETEIMTVTEAVTGQAGGWQRRASDPVQRMYQGAFASDPAKDVPTL